MSLPFKPNDSRTLGQSKNRAVARLLSIEKTFIKDQTFHQNYKQFIEEYINLGHAQLCSPLSSQDIIHTKHYYIPYQAVIRESSSTTKLRVVFDASSKTTSGISLNDQLLTGPTLQSDLFTIILKWRRHKFVISADIEKMYGQVKISPKHRTFQRFLWRNSTNEPI